MHSVRVLPAELRRSRSSHDLFGDDTATLRFFEQKKSMVGIHTCSLTEPADTRIRRKLMYSALNVHAERIPRELRVLVKPAVRAVQQFHIP